MPSPRQEVPDKPVQACSERASATGNIGNDKAGGITHTQGEKNENSSIPRNSCLSAGVQTNELKGFQKFPKSKRFARNAINILSEENERLKRGNILHKAKKKLFDQVEKLWKRNMKPGSLARDLKTGSRTERLAEAEQTILDPASIMIERRLFSDIPESITNEEGRRSRDWIVSNLYFGVPLSHMRAPILLK